MAWNSTWKKDATPESKEAEAQTDDEALDWGDSWECEDTPEYITLKPGTYPFRVRSFERGYSNGNAEKNTKPCPMAIVTLEIDCQEGTARVTERFLMRKSLKWRIDNFFRAIGVAKVGETYTPDWNMAIGATGSAKIKNETYNGNLYNKIDRFIIPE